MTLQELRERAEWRREQADQCWSSAFECSQLLYIALMDAREHERMAKEIDKEILALERRQ